MKKKKQDISIRELFRQKFENAEIIPDPSIRAKLMRKVARKEFLRFNPARFNIYYLGGILVAGIISALILSSGTGNSGQLNTSEYSGRTENKVISESVIVPGEKAQNQKTDTLSGKKAGIKTNNPIIVQKTGAVKEPSQNTKSSENIKVAHTGVIDSFKNSQLTEISQEKDKLKGGLRMNEVIFEPSATEGCSPLKIRFYTKVIDFDSCRWTFGDGGSSNKKEPEWIFDVEGEYKVVLKVFVADRLQSTSSTVITVRPKPVARFEILPGKAVLPDDEIRFLNYSANAVKYTWDFGDGSSSDLFEPVHRYSKFGNYNVGLVVSSEYGCYDSMVVLNAFSGSEYFIDFPNAFIPNPEGPSGGFYTTKSDESAQVFHPVFSGVSEYQLKIFSKMGILIFETSDISIGWDGYFKGQLSNPGVYIWKIRGKFRNGEPFIKMGDVTLLRNSQ